MSTELKKGDLVMTEHGVATNDEPSNDGFYYATLISGERARSKEPFPDATRADVEAYLKEKGWEYCSTKYGEWYRKDYVWDVRKGKSDQKWGIDVPFINENNFDTAPAQLAEAILVAELLNATKD